jgi:hypothetical protein
MLVDTMFGSGLYSTTHQISKYLVWTFFPVKNSPVFYTDQSLERVKPGRFRRIAWMHESPEITTSAYQWISRNNRLFDYVLTHQKTLLDFGDNFMFSPAGGCWIKPKEQQIHSKTKMVSIISSQKNLTTGHKMRIEILNNAKLKLQKFGRGSNPIKEKIMALRDFRYSVVIENSRTDYYFTEKIIHCFRTGTVPIYWGCPSIHEFFDLNGIITFQTLADLESILCGLSQIDYESRLIAIKNNFKLAEKYILSEDYIFEVYPWLFENRFELP